MTTLEYLHLLNGLFKHEIIVIGGWAVNLHTKQGITHDGDILISQLAFSTLRDFEPVNQNPRMQKAETKAPNGEDIDLYVEHQHGLRVSYQEAKQHAHKKDDLLVACPEHLIILKLEAYKQRQTSQKGRKDEEDLFHLLSLPPKDFQSPKLLQEHLSAQEWQTLQSLSQNNVLALKLSNGNALAAKRARTKITNILEWLQNPKSKKGGPSLPMS